VGQERQAAGGFNLIGYPVPVAEALQGHRCAFGELLQEGLDGAGLMVDPVLRDKLAVLVQNGELGIVLVGVASDPIMRHGCTSFTCALSRHECSGRCSAFI